MAGYRQFHTKFWKDEFMLELEPLERYLFTYLFTNELSSISGIYKLPLRVIINETGLEKDFVEKSFEKFEQAQKIMYRDGVMWVVKMGLYHNNASPLTMKKVLSDVAQIADCAVKRAYQYYQETGKYRIDTVSIPTLKSVSVIESESENLSERTSPPPPNFLAMSPDTVAIKVYSGVTGYMALPSGLISRSTDLWQFARAHGGISQAVEYLKPFFEDWKTRRTKAGAFYSKTGGGWIDWAIAGEAPARQPDPEPKPITAREGRRSLLTGV